MSYVWLVKYINISLLIFSYFVIHSHSRESGPNFRQEAAKISYCNEKYIKDLKVFTYRPKRNSPYLTSINATSFDWFGNNCTVVFEYANLKKPSETYAMEFKACDIFKFSWVQKFAERYSDMKTKCPVPPGTYHFSGFTLPPHDFPFPVSQGDYHVKFILKLTHTKERMLELEMDLKLQKKN